MLNIACVYQVRLNSESYISPFMIGCIGPKFLLISLGWRAWRVYALVGSVTKINREVRQNTESMLSFSGIIVAFTSHGESIHYRGVGNGIWGSIFFILTETFGIAVGIPLGIGWHPHDRICHLIASLVLSILFAREAFGFEHLALALSYFSFVVSTVDHSSNNSESAVGFSASLLAFMVAMFVCCLCLSVTAGINLCQLPPRTATHITSGHQQHPSGIVFTTTIRQGNTMYNKHSQFITSKCRTSCASQSLKEFICCCYAGIQKKLNDLHVGRFCSPPPLM